MSTYKFVAKDLMTEKVVCVHPDTPIPTLIKILIKIESMGRLSWIKKANLLELFQKPTLLNTMRKQTKTRSQQ